MAPKITTIALVAATAAVCSVGSAFAAATITGAQIKDGTVTGLDVKNGSLGAADLAAAARTALKGATGPSGPAGPAGAQGVAGVSGAAGAPGEPGLAAWDKIPSGQTVTGNFLEYHPSTGPGLNMINVDLPGVMSAAVGAGNINVAPSDAGMDDDAECTGTPTAPTAPAGKICIYIANDDGVGAASVVGYNTTLSKRGFRIRYTALNADQFFGGSWAYTAA